MRSEVNGEHQHIDIAALDCLHRRRHSVSAESQKTRFTLLLQALRQFQDTAIHHSVVVFLRITIVQHQNVYIVGVKKVQKIEKKRFRFLDTDADDVDDNDGLFFIEFCFREAKAVVFRRKSFRLLNTATSKLS